MAVHTLVPGSTLTHDGDESGNAIVTATIPPGNPGEGTYNTPDPTVALMAREAMSLGSLPGVTVDITVTGPNLDAITVIRTLP